MAADEVIHGVTWREYNVTKSMLLCTVVVVKYSIAKQGEPKETPGYIPAWVCGRYHYQMKLLIGIKDQPYLCPVASNHV